MRVHVICWLRLENDLHLWLQKKRSRGKDGPCDVCETGWLEEAAVLPLLGQLFFFQPVRNYTFYYY